MFLKFTIVLVILLCFPVFRQANAASSGVKQTDELKTNAVSNDLQFWERDPSFEKISARRTGHRRAPRPGVKNATSPKSKIVTKKNKFTTKSVVQKSTTETTTTTKKPWWTTTRLELRHKVVQLHSSVPSRFVVRGQDNKAYLRNRGTNNRMALRGSTLGVPDDPQNQQSPPGTEHRLVDPKYSSNSTGDSTGAPEKLSPYSILKQLTEMIEEFPEANVTTEVLGRTAEYNDLVLLKVALRTSDIHKYFRADDDRYADELPEKKIIFIVHGLSILGIDVMETFNSNQKLKKLLSYYFAHLDKFDIFLIPMANPDGFAYIMNRIGQSLWNKNMSPQSDCAGVALDRNFDVSWSNNRTLSSCSQQYPGPSPFSEPESRAVRDVMHRYSHKIVAYMHVHPGTYSANTFKGDAVLYPKGYTDVQSDDDKYIDLKGELDECMKNASFRQTSISADSLFNWYGLVTGTSVDYASSIYGIPFAMELVMQVYPAKEEPTADDIQNIALEEIWSRAIDVIFKSIHKNTNELQT